MNKIIAISNSIVAHPEVQTVNARDLHAFLEVGKDFSTWVKVQIERTRLVENQDFIVLPQKGEQNGSGGHNRIEYALTLDAGKHIAMMSQTDKGFEVRDYFIECERRLAKPKTQLELAREQVALLERLEQIEIERDRAIATKAEIGSRREATAMNTASQAVKQANSLQIELDRSKEYATIKRMEMIYQGVKFDWRKLRSTGIEMGIESIAVFDQNYGTVRSYHRDVWAETYAVTFS